VADEANPYAPPQAELLGPPPAAAPFFAVSGAKLSLMSIATFGLYELWWSYRNWKAVKLRYGEALSPFWRAFFAPLWNYSLFSHLDGVAAFAAVPASNVAGLMASLYFAANLVARAPDPYGFVGLLGFAALLPANGVAIRLNESLVPAAPPRAPWSVYDFVALAFGAIVWALGTIGFEE
jgi:hypothetical protein